MYVYIYIYIYIYIRIYLYIYNAHKMVSNSRREVTQSPFPLNGKTASTVRD